jgi:hypothetical protein
MANPPDKLGFVALLRDLVRAAEDRDRLCKEFQAVVWDAEVLPLSEADEEILRDLAHDLSYYEPDSEARFEDSRYFGDEELVVLVEEALGQLAK